MFLEKSTSRLFFANNALLGIVFCEFAIYSVVLYKKRPICLCVSKKPILVLHLMNKMQMEQMLQNISNDVIKSLQQGF